jgi:hypothetical protein
MRITSEYASYDDVADVYVREVHSFGVFVEDSIRGDDTTHYASFFLRVGLGSGRRYWLRFDDDLISVLSLDEASGG